LKYPLHTFSSTLSVVPEHLRGVRIIEIELYRIVRIFLIQYFFIFNLRCEFEYDLCAWRNLKDDDFDFSRAQGRTDSTGTGPKYDHTKLTTSGIMIFCFYSS